MHTHDQDPYSQDPYSQDPYSQDEEQQRDQLLTPEEVAAITGLTIDELAHQRHAGAGPEWAQINRVTIRYSANDVHTWINRHSDPSGQEPVHTSRRGERRGRGLGR